MGSGLTEVNAAAQLKPTLALVWLGANDVLKFMGSGGLFHGGDSSPGQAASDLRQTIGTLRRAGAHVVVANLPNILETPYFMRVTIPSPSICVKNVQTYITCVFEEVLQVSPSTAAGLTARIAASYHLATPNGCEPTSTSEPCGYVTLQGTFAIIDYYHEHGKLPDLDNGKPGSGLGMFYITPAFAAKVQALNSVVNDGIATAAQRTSTPMVDVASIFSGIASGDKSNPYFRLATSISPANECCTLGFEGGLVSFDGLHPSNTGYALLASAFISVINGAYGTGIPQINVKAAYNGTRCGNTSYCYPDPYAPPCAQNPALCGPSSGGIVDRRRPTSS
jgi:lysophospholipase L1-like esterase